MLAKSLTLLLALSLSLGAFSSCRPKKGADPLQNTRQLVVRGHKSLYFNGAFKIPSTEIRIIPPGPSPMEIAQDLVGLRARMAFLLALKAAANSIYVVRDGTRYSFRKASAINEKAAEIARVIREKAHEKGIYIVQRSFFKGTNLVARSWNFSGQLISEMDGIGDSIINAAWDAGDRMKARLRKSGLLIIQDSAQESRRIMGASLARSGTRVKEGYEAFIMGYASLPKALQSNASSVGESLKKANLVKVLKEENQWRSKVSNSAQNIVVRAVTDYPGDVSDSFRKAGKDLKAYKETGISLATLKAMRWVLKGIFWDAILKPISHVTFGGLGYILVNAVAYPTIVIIREGLAIANVAVQATWNTAKSLYQIIAPTGILAVASIFSIFDVTGSTTAAGVIKGGGYLAGQSQIRRGAIGNVLVKGGGYAAGKTVQYIGVPLAAAGIAIGGTTVGAVYAAAGSIPGAAVIVTGEAAAATTRAFGIVLSGAVMTSGPVIATGVASTHAVYRLAKAVVVPTTYTLGAGLVLSYGTLSHLAAHTLLAASDCAYLVLSLEGPRWVVYAVQGKLGKGNNLPTGAVINLKKMQKAGETIKYIPVSASEMR
ncbi:hypothetical protein KKF84_02080, partial [Myxococcota bacterium]|nr:hypothetical protein [Myxococcota bacterium]